MREELEGLWKFGLLSTFSNSNYFLIKFRNERQNTERAWIFHSNWVIYKLNWKVNLLAFAKHLTLLASRSPSNDNQLSDVYGNSLVGLVTRTRGRLNFWCSFILFPHSRNLIQPLPLDIFITPVDFFIIHSFERCDAIKFFFCSPEICIIKFSCHPLFMNSKLCVLRMLRKSFGSTEINTSKIRHRSPSR